MAGNKPNENLTPKKPPKPGRAKFAWSSVILGTLGFLGVTSLGGFATAARDGKSLWDIFFPNLPLTQGAITHLVLDPNMTLGDYNRATTPNEAPVSENDNVPGARFVADVEIKGYPNQTSKVGWILFDADTDKSVDAEALRLPQGALSRQVTDFQSRADDSLRQVVGWAPYPLVGAGHFYIRVDIYDPNGEQLADGKTDTFTVGPATAPTQTISAPTPNGTSTPPGASPTPTRPLPTPTYLPFPIRMPTPYLRPFPYPPLTH